MRHILMLRGTGERFGNSGNLLARAASRGRMQAGVEGTPKAELDDVRVVEVNYPASIGAVNEHLNAFGVSLNRSISAALHEIRREIAIAIGMDSASVGKAYVSKRDTEIVLAGYSLGALAVLHALKMDSWVREKVNFSVLVANPALKYGHVTGGGTAPNGYLSYSGQSGITSGYVNDQVPANAGPVYNVAWMKDPIVYLEVDSPLRDVVPFLWDLQVGRLHEWGEELLRDLYVTGVRMSRQKTLQLRFKQAQVERARYDKAIAAIQRYVGGEHNRAYGESHWYHNGKRKTGVQLAGDLMFGGV